MTLLHRQKLRKFTSFITSSSFVFFLGSWGMCPAWGLLPDEANNVEVFAKCNPSTVNITTVTLRWDFFADVVPQEGLGSGAIIHSDGYIVTNDHVIGDAQKINVTLWDKSTYPATVVGRDMGTDLAVIKINAAKKKLTPLKYANPSKLSVGQKVLAIGNPFGLGASLTTGIISSLDRHIRGGSRGRGRKMQGVIQTDAAINPGNSGGPLINSDAELVGINSQIFSTSGGSHGIGFAISVKDVKRIADELIKFGQVQRPWIGMNGLGMSRALLKNFKVKANQGVMITEIHRSSPASKAGLKPATKELIWGFQRIPYGGDIVFQIDNTPVQSMRDIEDYIFEKKVGDKIVIHYFRAGKSKIAKLTLTVPPSKHLQDL